LPNEGNSDGSNAFGLSKLGSPILPLRSLRLNSLPDDPEAAAKPVADAAENEANEPDNAFSPGVPALIEGWPDELLIKFMPKVDLLDDGIFCC
jgi:hypothetical protein